MGSHREQEITRRSLLASIGGIAGVAVASRAAADEKETAGAVFRPRDLSQARKEFERLLPLWQEERKQFGPSSNTQDYWQGPHGKAIIALGPAIIPELIQQVRSGDFWFNVPLALITRVDISNGHYESEQANSKLWLAWWDAAGKTPSAGEASNQASNDSDSDAWISFESSVFQSKDALSARWKQIPPDKRKQIATFLLMRLGLSSTGKIQLIGVYRDPEKETSNGQERTLLHFQQLDLLGGRLFWSVLVDPDASTARVLYHVNKAFIAANKTLGADGPISIVDDDR